MSNNMILNLFLVISNTVAVALFTAWFYKASKSNFKQRYRLISLFFIINTLITFGAALDVF